MFHKGYFLMPKSSMKKFFIQNHVATLCVALTKSAAFPSVAMVFSHNSALLVIGEHHQLHISLPLWVTQCLLRAYSFSFSEASIILSEYAQILNFTHQQHFPSIFENYHSIMIFQFGQVSMLIKRTNYYLFLL